MAAAFILLTRSATKKTSENFNFLFAQSRISSCRGMGKTQPFPMLEPERKVVRALMNFLRTFRFSLVQDLKFYFKHLHKFASREGP